MKLENQICSLELAKRLKELGVKQDGYFTWHRMNHTAEYEVIVTTLTDVPKSSRGWAASDFSAFTVAELGEMLPALFSTQKCTTGLIGSVVSLEYQGGAVSIQGGTEADARAKMLIYLIEKGLMKP